jgi:transposase InsO family protein
MLPWSRSSPQLQRNALDRQRSAAQAELRLAIVTWIERTYHRGRRQRALGKLTPIEFELLHTPVATAPRPEIHTPRVN